MGRIANSVARIHYVEKIRDLRKSHDPGPTMDYYDYINELIPDAPEWAVSQLAVDMADLAKLAGRAEETPDYRTRMVDGFAAMALSGILASGPNMASTDPMGLAKVAYKYADAMLAAREEDDR